MSGVPTTYKGCPVCATPAPADAAQCLKCGHTYRTKFVPPSPNQTQFFQAPHQPTQGYNPYAQQRHDSTRLLLILLLWLFVGHVGAHRLYLGHIGSAIGMAVLHVLGWLTIWFAVGFVFLIAASIWWLVDLLLILTGRLYFKDGTRVMP